MKLAGTGRLATLALLSALAACRAPTPHATEQGTLESNIEDSPVAQPSELGPGEAVLRVRFVTKETGEPMAGVVAGISLMDRSNSEFIASPSVIGESEGAGGSDAEGWAEFVVRGDVPFSIEVLDHAYGRVSLQVKPLRGGMQRQIVVPIATQDDIVLVGRIVSAEDGAAIADAEVKLEVEEFWTEDGADRPVQSSGPDGSFELSAASWKHPYGSVFAPGFAPAAFRVTGQHASAARALVVKMQRPASLEARIVDVKGAPIAGARVRLATSPDNFLQGDDASQGDDLELEIRLMEWNETTGDDGRCTIEGLEPGVPIDVVYDAPDRLRRHESEPLVLSPGERRMFELVHRPGSTITGRLEDQLHQPVADCSVWLLPARSERREFFRSWDEPFARVTPDANGIFRIEDVPPGLWRIGPWDERESEDAGRDPLLIAPIASAIRVYDGANPSDVVLAADRGLYITGRVLAPDGTPAPGTFIDFETDDLFSEFSASSDGDGEFVLGPLSAATWTLTAGPGESFAESKPVAVAAGAQDVVLQLERGGHLRVHVIDASTGSRCGARVQLARLGDSSWIERDTDEGEIDFDERGAGTYSAFANTDDGRVAFAGGIELPPGGDVGPIVLRLRPGSTLRVRYAGKSESVRCLVSAGLIPLDFDDLQSGGEAEFTGLPSDVVVELTNVDAGTSAKQTVHVAAGEEREVVFDAP